MRPFRLLTGLLTVILTVLLPLPCALKGAPLCALAFAAEETARVVSRIVFVGDVMLAESEGTGRYVAQGGDPLAKVRDLLSPADLRVANFESSAGTQGKPDPQKPFSFRTSPGALASFASVFDAASLANNHAADFGRADLLETAEALRQSGSQPFGSGKDAQEAHRATIVERRGLKIGLLGYLDVLPRWFAAAPDLPGVAWLDIDQASLDIKQARQNGADVVIVLPHWGTEHAPQANDRQRRLARALLDAGADAVIGGHPHVVQDYEIYKGKPVIYSLGNFVFDGFEDEDNNTGWALFVDLDRRGVVSLSTRVVRIDANGSPAPEPGLAGPCWKRGEVQMRLCEIARLKAQPRP